MSDFEKTYTLAQQTPLIHFQHSEDGATLRATEVKPKLDRFLLKRLEAEGTNPQEDWFVKRDPRKGALDYKMRFEMEKGRTVELGPKTPYEMYYGNMNLKQEEKIRGVVSENGRVRMNIVCFHPKLRQKIHDSLNEFFFVTNFGRMQDKGFGSFRMANKPTEKDVADALCRKYGARTCYYFEFGADDQPLNQIKTVYSLMKSGINFPNKIDPSKSRYRRSLLFVYLHEWRKDGRAAPIGNEKAWLKQMGMAPTDVGVHAQEWHTNQQDDQPRYARALLGTGDHEDFVTDLAHPKESRVTVKIDGLDEAPERVPSPIFFKVLDNRVYFVGGRLCDEVFGKKFMFSSKYNGDDKIIQTPDKEEDGFDENFLDDFLAYCMRELNNPNPSDGGTPMQNFPGMQNVEIREVNLNA